MMSVELFRSLESGNPSLEFGCFPVPVVEMQAGIDPLKDQKSLMNLVYSKETARTLDRGFDPVAPSLSPVVRGNANENRESTQNQKSHDILRVSHLGTVPSHTTLPPKKMIPTYYQMIKSGGRMPKGVRPCP